ncbi:hypothetical protein RND64_02425 [Gordonia sp. w5E2]|uniref:PE-PGRS family protein n=1 Tax=Gordonia jacobaea TaxID=122202 RepID=A0ABR5I7Z6_9ACTN|nr:MULTISPECIES: hypothetical protein [Gordonia]KNA89805.1 hypothetical protein ABW18_19195 [Gordonia jacobaea]SKX75242.1 Uncharacterised protein [Mycobacteroides abscessus subsp. abscessus]
MKNAVVRPGVGALALTGMSIASAAVIAAVPAMSQAATVAATEGAASTTQLVADTATVGAHALTTLAADADPTQIYADAIQRALTNIETLQANSPDKALPILSQVLENQLNLVKGVADGAANGEWKAGTSPDFAALWKQASEAAAGVGPGLSGAVNDVADALRNDVPQLLAAVTAALKAGDIESAMNNILLVAVAPIYAAINPSTGSVMPALMKILDVPLDAGLALAGAIPNDRISAALSEPFAAGKRLVYQVPEVVLFAGIGIISPLAGGLGAVGHAVQSVVDGAEAGDIGQVATALMQAPGVMLDGLLNGGYGPSVGNIIGLGDFPVINGGLLHPALDSSFDEDGQLNILLPGTLGALQHIVTSIAGALAPLPPKTSYTVDASSVASAPIVRAATPVASDAQDATTATDLAETATSSESTDSGSSDAGAVPPSESVTGPGVTDGVTGSGGASAPATAGDDAAGATDDSPAADPGTTSGTDTAGKGSAGTGSADAGSAEAGGAASSDATASADSDAASSPSSASSSNASNASSTSGSASK